MFASLSSHPSKPKKKYRILFVGDNTSGTLELLNCINSSKEVCDLCSKITIQEKQKIQQNFFQTRIIHHNFNEVDIHLGIWIIKGGESYKALRSIFYDSADAIILIFSLVQKVTYENITSIWAKEVGQYVAEVPIFLVGTDLEQWDQIYASEKNNNAVKMDEVFNFCSQMHYSKYLECSVVTGEGVETLIQELVRSLIAPKKKTIFLFPSKKPEKIHSFRLHEFEVPKICNWCSEFIWQGKKIQGYNCNECGFNVHLHCQSLLSKEANICGNYNKLKKHKISEKDGIPTIVFEIANYIENNVLETEGLFRVSGLESEVKKLYEKFMKGKVVDLSIFDTHAITGALKRYFRLMINPLIPYELFESFIETYNLEEEMKKEAMKKLIKALPLENQATLARLAILFSKILKHREKNKMTEENLSICFATTILRPRDGSVDLIQIQIQVFGYLMLHFEELMKEKHSTEIVLPENFNKRLQRSVILLGSMYLSQKEEQDEVETRPRRNSKESTSSSSLSLRELDQNEKEGSSTKALLAPPVNIEGREMRKTESKFKSDELIEILKNGNLGEFVEKLNTSDSRTRERLKTNLLEMKVQRMNATDTHSSFEYTLDTIEKEVKENDKENDEGKEKQKSLINIYQGETKDGIPYGKGLMKYGQEFEYLGDWVNGERHGKGTFRWIHLDCIYEGEWSHDERDGKGKMIWHDKSSYEGEWKHDTRNGYGIFKWSNGTYYQGEWKDDVRNGKGKRVYPNGEVYIGEYRHDVRHGEGILEKTDWTYIGTFKEGKRHGHGKLVWRDGKVYEGLWKKDKREGYGEMKWANGNCYKGSWKNDAPANRLK